MSGAMMSLPPNTSGPLGFSGTPVPVREQIAAAIRNVSAKTLARVTGRTPKAAEKWKAADNTVTVETLFALAAEFDDVWEIVKQRCGRANDVDDAVVMLNQMRDMLAQRRPPTGRQDAPTQTNA
jgi:hypothetical protein